MNNLGEKLGFFAILLTMIGISTANHPLILVFCYAIHESGHMVFAKIAGAKFNKIRPGFFRLCLPYNCSNISYKNEILVCAGGIIFNLFFALLSFISGVWKFENGRFFMICNLAIALMNLYPVSVLDGGNILRCFFLNRTDGEKGEKTVSLISFISAFVMWVFAIYFQLIFSADISIFVISVLLLIELCFSYNFR